MSGGPKGAKRPLARQLDEYEGLEDGFADGMIAGNSRKPFLFALVVGVGIFVLPFEKTWA